MIELNNGVEMPGLGLGVFQTPPAETVGAVETAIEDGYRLIDTAAAYMKEREVGEAIRRCGIDRGEMFVSTKLWISDYGYEPALRGFEGCRRRLGFDDVDLFLDHDGRMGNTAVRAVEAITSRCRHSSDRAA
jgi:diketogulonate reductase-like aldo/keto reductase